MNVYFNEVLAPEKPGQSATNPPRPPETNMSPVLSWSISNLAPWTPSERVHSVNSFVPITLSLARAVPVR